MLKLKELSFIYYYNAWEKTKTKGLKSLDRRKVKMISKNVLPFNISYLFFLIGDFYELIKMT